VQPFRSTQTAETTEYMEEHLMNSAYNRTRRISPTGIATASILLVTLVMAASLLFDRATEQGFGNAATAQSTTQGKGSAGIVADRHTALLLRRGSL
jgi:hypothetical protein